MTTPHRIALALAACQGLTDHALAAMRCRVAARLGPTVDVPQELVR